MRASRKLGLGRSSGFLGGTHVGKLLHQLVSSSFLFRIEVSSSANEIEHRKLECGQSIRGSLRQFCSHKIEEAGVIQGYSAVLDARRLGRDVTAFIGVTMDRAGAIHGVEGEVAAMSEVLECHHVTGLHSLLLKAKTRSRVTLEVLIERIRSLEGVSRTETMVVLSTQTERFTLPLDEVDEPEEAPARRTGSRSRRAAR